MGFTRITDADLTGKGVIGQPDVPGLSALEMQQKVEQVVREVAIPAVNRLAGELEAEAGASSIGMELPEGMPAGTPATVQGVTEAHIEDTSNPHAVTAAQVGAYTKAETDTAINEKVVEIGTGDMAKAVYDPTGKNTDVFAYCAAASESNLKTYSSVTQLGIVAGAYTTAQVYGAMPGASIAMLIGTDVSDAPTSQGTLVIYKYSLNRGRIFYYDKNTTSDYYMLLNTSAGPDGASGVWVAV